MKIKDWYKENKTYFKLSELNFIFKSFGLDDLSYLISQDKILSHKQLAKLRQVKDSHLRGIPLAFSLSREEFFGFTFQVSSDSLIPRPETELLVEVALAVIHRNKLGKVLDLCCGCGNIGISLDKLSKGGLKVCLSDFSLEVLSLARENAVNLSSKVKIIASDLFSGFKFDSFDLVITNPPYVENKNIKGSLVYEPKLALDGGKDGLNFLREIIKDGHRYLKKQGYLIIEFGYNQKESLERIVQENSHYKIIKWIKDYGKNWRGVILQKNNV